MPVAAANNIDIAYEIRGEGPPVLFIAGLACGGNVWDPLAEELRPFHTSITFDNRGVGGTSAPRETYSITQMADDAAALLRQLGIAVGDTIIVGHSMGGFIALHLATRKPAPAALVLVATAAKGGSPVEGMSKRAREAFYRKSGPRQDIVRGIVDAGVGETTKTEQRQLLEHKLLTVPLRAPGYLGQGAAVAAFDGRNRLGRVRCPCTVVHGVADEMIPLAKSEEIGAAIAGSKLVTLDGVGHFPQIEATSALAREIREMRSRIAK